jgi:hypothetical protein
MNLELWAIRKKVALEPRSPFLHRIFSSVSTFGENPTIETPETPKNNMIDNLIFR